MSQSRGGGRSRIVIDVSQAQAEAEARRSRGGRRRRLLSTGALVIIGVVLLASVFGYLWWRGFRQGPAYSLALLLDSARSEDLPAVEQFVDADQVAQGFVPQVIEKLTGAGAGALPPQVRGQVSAALPQLIPRVRGTMSQEVTSALKRFADDAAGSTPTPLVALGISRIAEIEQQDDSARVLLKREEKITELQMRRAGERWRIIAIKDDEMASTIAARLAASIPPAAAAPAPAAQGSQRRQGR
jgi:hypothetical protein